MSQVLSFFTEGEVLKRAVDADHNCLFYSIGYCLENLNTSKEMAQSLRDYVGDTILGNPYVYTAEYLDKDPLEYANWIKNSENWGGAIELAIFAEKYACEIGAFNVQSNNMECYGQGNNYQQRVYVIYDGLHYDPMVLTFDANLPADCDVTIFHPEDVYVFSKGQNFCGSMNKSRQFTDTSTYSLICLVCGQGLNGNQGAVNHAKKTGHQNFAQNEGGQSLGGSGGNQSSYSDTPEPTIQLTEEEKAERLRALEERIKEKKSQAEEQARIDQLESEKQRREFGKKLNEQREERERQEMINEARRIKKEKQENKIAREKIKAKLEQDKLNRTQSVTNQETTNETVSEPVSEPPTPTSTRDTSTIQFRIPGGTLKETFPLEATLSDLENYIQTNIPNIGPFSMMTTFPRRVYNQNEYHLTLLDADLSGRPQIVIQKK